MDLAAAIRTIRTQMFTENSGSRTTSHKVAVVMLEGELNHHRQLARTGGSCFHYFPLQSCVIQQTTV